MGIKFEWSTGRYEATLPWRSEVRPLSNCHFLCVNKLNQLFKRLSKNGSILSEYDKSICRQLDDGIIERVPLNEESLSGGHFLPHHGVMCQDKEISKLRIVFDGSANESLKDFSLNDCLQKGPNSTPHIFDTLLLKFRSYSVGI